MKSLVKDSVGLIEKCEMKHTLTQVCVFIYCLFIIICLLIFTITL